jgi:hypothetical protein
MFSRQMVVAIVLVAIAASPRANSQTSSRQPQDSTAASGSSSVDPKSQQTEARASGTPEVRGSGKSGKTPEELEVERKEQSQRILGIVPNFGTTSRHDAPPLTAGQKFHLFAKGTVDPFNWFAIGLQAGISQAENEFPAYGQGAAGFGKRYGAALADSTSSGFFANFFYPTILKQDPRYFRLGEGTIKHRIVYSLAQEFVCRTDKGTRQVNLSNIFGAFTAGGVSNLYYPPSDRGFSLTMSRSAISLLYGSTGGLISEFWPDIDRTFIHKKHSEQPSKTLRNLQTPDPTSSRL